MIDIGVFEIPGTLDFGVKAGFEIFLTEARTSRGVAIPQQKGQNPKIAPFQGRRLFFACRDTFGHQREPCD